jgi:hypothetical protein
MAFRRRLAVRFLLAIGLLVANLAVPVKGNFDGCKVCAICYVDHDPWFVNCCGDPIFGGGTDDCHIEAVSGECHPAGNFCLPG